MDYVVLLKIIGIYFIILIIMKFMGKREIGQLSLFDFAVILIIADIAVSGLGNENEFFLYILGILILGIIQKVLAFIGLKFSKVRKFLDGKQSPIIIEGKLNIKEMKKQSYNIDDLIIQMRLKNIRSISEIRYLILESNGEISTFLYEEFPSSKEPSSSTASKTQNVVTSNKTADTSKSKQVSEIYPFPVIISGKIEEENIKILNLSKDFIEKEIKKQGYKDIKDIYYANYEYGGLFIAKTCDF